MGSDSEVSRTTGSRAVAVHDGHDDVGDHHIGLEVIELLEGLLSVVGDADLEVVLLQHVLELHGLGAAVLDHENAMGFAGHAGCLSVVLEVGMAGTGLRQAWY